MVVQGQLTNLGRAASRIQASRHLSDALPNRNDFHLPQVVFLAREWEEATQAANEGSSARCVSRLQLFLLCPGRMSLFDVSDHFQILYREWTPAPLSVKGAALSPGVLCWRLQGNEATHSPQIAGGFELA